MHSKKFLELFFHLKLIFFKTKVENIIICILVHLATFVLNHSLLFEFVIFWVFSSLSVLLSAPPLPSVHPQTLHVYFILYLMFGHLNSGLGCSFFFILFSFVSNISLTSCICFVLVFTCYVCLCVCLCINRPDLPVDFAGSSAVNPLCVSLHVILKLPLSSS